MKGMAHNVPFTFGNITLFLQVHIMETTVYDVLLGRPFDALARTEIRNCLVLQTKRIRYQTLRTARISVGRGRPL